MSRVFIVQENRHLDFGAAEHYGELVFLTADEFKPVVRSPLNDRIIEEIKANLSDFNAKEDFIILNGNPTIIGFAFAEAMSRCGPLEGLRVLQWEKRSHEYRPYEFGYKPTSPQK